MHTFRIGGIGKVKHFFFIKYKEFDLINMISHVLFLGVIDSDSTFFFVTFFIPSI